MKYIPGPIHRSLQKSHYYLLRSDFAWSICTKRFSEFTDIYDWDIYTTKVQLFEGDIIQLRFFKLDELSISQCYLEKVIRINGDEEVYKAEANIFHSFIMNNLVKDNSNVLKNTPIFVLKTYEQQIPLSYHYKNIDLSTRCIK